MVSNGARIISDSGQGLLWGHSDRDREAKSGLMFSVWAMRWMYLHSDLEMINTS